MNFFKKLFHQPKVGERWVLKRPEDPFDLEPPLVMQIYEVRSKWVRYRYEHKEPDGRVWQGEDRSTSIQSLKLCWSLSP